MDQIMIPGLAERKEWWRALLVDEDLVDRSLYIFEPYDSAPDIAIPVGKHRRTGYCFIRDDEFRQAVFNRLKLNPLGYPDLRFSSLAHRPNELEWGEDITHLWEWHKRVKGLVRNVHIALGHAFGYKEERILTLYPENWPENKKESDAENYEKNRYPRSLE